MKHEQRPHMKMPLSQIELPLPRTMGSGMVSLFRWQSVDPTRNRFRFYSLSVDMDLWEELVLIKRWGRIGTRGQRQFVWGPAAELGKLVEQIKRERELHGYQVLNSAYKIQSLESQHLLRIPRDQNQLHKPLL